MSEAKWYVVHTYSGYENKVKVDIEKTIENRNLQDQILEVSVPMLEVAELKNGVEKLADKRRRDSMRSRHRSILIFCLIR